MQGEEIVAIHKSLNGNIISFQTSTGRIISYRKAIEEASNGQITGVSIFEDDHGTPMITPVNNTTFEHLPEIY